MKRLASWALALALLFAATTADAGIVEFWKLGYRAVDPFAVASPLGRTIDNSRRYLVRVGGQFVVWNNPAGEDVRAYLPLPADDAYQRVFVSRLRPAPVKIVRSRYGYEIAVYNYGPLKAGSGFEIYYDAEVALGKIRWDIDPDQVGTLAEVPEQIKQDYLGGGRFYKTNDPIVQAAALKAVGDETNPYWMMAKIIRYARSRLTYVLDGHKGDAVETLAARHGSCTEFTFVLIGMARAVGLPARYMSGSFYKKNVFTRHFQDRVYHKIVEIYLPRIGWVPVESTGSARRAERVPEKLIGDSSHLMLFFTHEPEPGLVPLDPRRNLITHRPFGLGSKLKVDRRVQINWERLR
jgi:transglutaminase-like putative cysteine protease